MYEIILESNRLEEVVEICLEASVLALDTEFTRTSTYYPIVGLIQIFDGKNCYLIDPLSVKDMSSLTKLLCDSSVIKVLHACSEDMEVFQYALGVTPTPAFDSQIAAAILGVGFSLSYQKLVEHYLSLQISKEETRSDWLKRPLNNAQLEYAALDVIHLYDVYMKQKTELEQLNRLEWVTSDCASLPNNISTLVEPEAYYLKVKNISKLSRPQLNILRSLCAWRENKARKLNVPRNRVVEEKSLFNIALQNNPLSERRQLEEFIPKGQMHRHGDEIVEVLKKASQTSSDEQPASMGSTKTPLSSQSLRELRQVVEKCADSLNISQELLAKRRQLEQLLRSQDKNGVFHLPESLKGWREEIIGRPLLNFLEKKT
jgi:ribonuclease D